MGMMKWPLDYLDARPTCVLNEYLDRVEEFARTGSAIGAVQDRHGWHNCATVIDPLVGETRSMETMLANGCQTQG